MKNVAEMTPMELISALKRYTTLYNESVNDNGILHARTKEYDNERTYIEVELYRRLTGGN